MKTGVGRWLASGLLLLFALLAVFNGLDRFTEHQPSAIRLVPAVFRSHAARAEAAQALAVGEAARAQEAAAAAIRADPLDRRGATFLGAAAAMLGDEALADRSFAIADRLGLREPVVQAWFFGRAIEAQDYSEAAVRIDLLLRAHPELEPAQSFITQLEQSPQGRRKLLGRLAREPQWANAYLQGWRADDATLRERARTLADESAALQLGCERIAPMVRALEQRNLRLDARRVREAQCPDARSGPAIVDTGFDAVGGTGEFGWRRHLGGDVRVGTSEAGVDGIALSSRASVTRLMLSQPVALEPGEYRAFASIGGAGVERVTASLDCGETARPGRGGGALGRGQLLRAPPCDNLVLGIWLRPGEGVVMLDNLRIEPIGVQTQSRP